MRALQKIFLDNERECGCECDRSTCNKGTCCAHIGEPCAKCDARKGLLTEAAITIGCGQCGENLEISAFGLSETLFIDVLPCKNKCEHPMGTEDRIGRSSR